MMARASLEMGGMVSDEAIIKRTFKLNGHEVPRPVSGKKAVFRLFVASKMYFFETSKDREGFIRAIRSIMDDAEHGSD